MKKQYLKRKNNVYVWGVFDLVHKGHFEFLRHAAKYGPLHVIIVPDHIVYQNKNRPPIESEDIRKQKLERLPFVEKAFIDSIENGLSCFDVIRPDIFCFGHDQSKLWQQLLLKLLTKKGYCVTVKKLRMYANGIHTKNIRPFFTSSNSH